MKSILVVNALNGVFPLVLRRKYPGAKITCAEVFPFYKHHLVNLGFEVVDWEALKDVKFDMIVGNPPYQSNEAVGKKLWPLFVQKCFDLCEDGGYLCMVTPATWIVRPQGKSMKTMTQEVFKSNRLQWVDLRTEKYFDVGEKIAAWLLHKEPNAGQTTQIHTHAGVINVVYTGQQIALSPEEQRVYDIMALLETSNTPRLREYVYNDVVTSISIDEQISKKMIYDQPGKTRAPLYWTASNTGSYYLDRNKIKPGIKVILNKSGYYYQDQDPNKYMMIDLTSAYGIGAGALGITCDSMKHATNMTSFLKSHLYQFYINNEKTSGFNTGIIKLPMLDSRKKWTDAMVYDFFHLTPQQIAFVEANYMKKYSG